MTKIPQIVLEGEKYRSEVADRYAHIKRDPAEVQIEEEEESAPPPPSSMLDLDREFASVKERTNYILNEIYEQKGYDLFREVCLSMKENTGFDGKQYGEFKGEAAEVYLYVTIKEFIKKFGLKWKVFLSLVIPHSNGQEGATTECDVVLISEEMITVFEAKSYNGNNKLVDVCTIKTQKFEKDVYSQNMLHTESLIKQLETYSLATGGGMKSALFSFASGKLKDLREEQHRRFMPVINESNLLKYLTTLTKLEKKHWNDGIYAKVDELSKTLTVADHIAYLKKEGVIK